MKSLKANKTNKYFKETVVSKKNVLRLLLILFVISTFVFSPEFIGTASNWEEFNLIENGVNDTSSCQWGDIDDIDDGSHSDNIDGALILGPGGYVTLEYRDGYIKELTIWEGGAGQASSEKLEIYGKNSLSESWPATPEISFTAPDNHNSGAGSFIVTFPASKEYRYLKLKDGGSTDSCPGWDLLEVNVTDSVSPPECHGEEATIWVDDNDIIHGGPYDGQDYTTLIGESDYPGHPVNGFISGTDGDDVIVGTEDTDLIEGYDSSHNDGQDLVCGLGGDDYIYGYEGDDTFYGGSGDDLLILNPGGTGYGEEGDDTVAGKSYTGYGGRGDDIVKGSTDTSSEVLYGGPGNDSVLGGPGDDCLCGGTGWDYLQGNKGEDCLTDLSSDNETGNKADGYSGTDNYNLCPLKYTKGTKKLENFVDSCSCGSEFNGHCPPVAKAGNDSSIDEGSSLSLDASESFDYDDGIVSYSLDLNGDGDYGDATGESPTLTWDILTDHGIDDGPGTYTIELKVSDPDVEMGWTPQNSSPTTDSLEVTVNNVAPTANSQSVTIDEDTPVDITLTGSDPGNDTLTYTLDTGPASGSTSLSGNTVTYTPNEDYNGEDSFTYRVADDDGAADTAEVIITVNPVNDAPTDISLSSSTVDENKPVGTVVGDLSSTDPDSGESFTYSLVSGDTDSFQISGDSLETAEQFDYENKNSYTIRLQTEDSGGKTYQESFTISVGDVNESPQAVDDTATTDEDMPVDINVLANDTDPDTGDDLSVASTTDPSNGSVTISSDGTVTYTPDENFQGTDTFTYTVTDGNGGTDTAEVQITVDSTIDPPQADDDTATTDEDTPVTTDVLDNDTDPDGSLDTSSVTVISGPGNGSTTLETNGDITYTPDTNYHGEDSFTYRVRDDDGATDTATVTVTINPVNDPPVAVDDTAITEEDTSVDIDVLANDSDPDDGDTLSVSSITQPANGQGTNNDDGTLTYTPDTDYNGKDTFSYTVSDENGGTDTATVTVTVSSVEDNTPPVAENRFATTCNDESLTVTLEATDPEIDPDQPEEHPIDFSIWSQPREGEVTGDLTDVTYEEDHVATVEVTYTPPEGFTGTDFFTYQVEDSTGAFDQAEVRVTVEKCEETTAGEAGAAVEVTDTASDVAINELAWAGTEASPDHEWIELINNTESEIDLTGWIIRFKREEDESWREITLTGTISPKGYYLLERISDDTVSNVAANLIYDKEKPYELSLSDKGELVELLDKKGNVVDTANSRNTKKGWPAGSTKPVSSMERIDPAKADTGNNWDSNQGRITAGVDSDGHELRATPSKVNENFLLGRELRSHPRKIREGKVLSALVRKPDGETNNFDGLLAKSAKVAAGGAGSLVKSDALTEGNSQALDKYHVVFDTSKVEPGKYRIFLVVGNEVIFQQYVEVVN